jgi:hypothetical protein
VLVLDRRSWSRWHPYSWGPTGVAIAVGLVLAGVLALGALDEYTRRHRRSATPPPATYASTPGVVAIPLRVER